MTPDEMRKRIRQLKWFWSEVDAGREGGGFAGLGNLFCDVMIDTSMVSVCKEFIEAIAENRCTDPQTCARELVFYIEKMRQKEYIDKLAENASHGMRERIDLHLEYEKLGTQMIDIVKDATEREKGKAEQ